MQSHCASIDQFILLDQLVGAIPDRRVVHVPSLPQILPKTMARDEILRREALCKAKLGSRAKGLNLN